MKGKRRVGAAWLPERWVAGSERGLPGGSRRGSDGRSSRATKRREGERRG